MAISLESSSIAHPDDLKDELTIRSELIEECNSLLKRLDNGSYLISWNGMLPQEKNQLKYHRAKKLGIKIDSTIRYGKFIHPWKPYVVKKIRIQGKDFSCVKSWKTQQIAEFLKGIKFLKSDLT